MKAISRSKAEAEDLAAGRQTVLLLHWPTPYRGPLVICALPRPTSHEPHDCEAVCIVDLVECRRARPSDAAAAGRKDLDGYTTAWELANVRPITPPQRVKGMFLLFDVELQVGPPAATAPVAAPPARVTVQPAAGLPDVVRVGPARAPPKKAATGSEEMQPGLF